MPLPTVDQFIPLGMGAGQRGSSRIPGGTGLIVLVGVIQLLGFAIPVVTFTGEAYGFQWTYGGFSLHSPGLLEWVFYLPALGIGALFSIFLPTQFLRPSALIVIGAAPLVILYQHPEVQARFLERMLMFGWSVGKASALKGIALLALAIAAAIISTHAPKGVVVGAGLVAAVPAVIYLGVPLDSEFPGGFAWKSRFTELMSTQPVETAWSEVAGHYMLLAAFGIDLVAIGLAALLCLLAFRNAGYRAGRWVGWCVAISLLTTVLVIVGRAIGPLHDVTFEVEVFVCELALTLKMLLATLSIFLLLPVAVIDLIGRAFGWRL